MALLDFKPRQGESGKSMVISDCQAVSLAGIWMSKNSSRLRSLLGPALNGLVPSWACHEGVATVTMIFNEYVVINNCQGRDEVHLRYIIFYSYIVGTWHHNIGNY